MNNSVLIIEDDKELGELFVDILTLEGMDAGLIRDGGQALDRIGSQPPDIVVLDMHLPHVSGLEILTCLRATPATANIKVMVVTADAMLADSAKHLANAVLLKPVMGDDLVETAKRLLKELPSINQTC